MKKNVLLHNKKMANTNE